MRQKRNVFKKSSSHTLRKHVMNPKGKSQLRFQDLTVIITKSTVFCNAMSCSVVERCLCVGGTSGPISEPPNPISTLVASNFFSSVPHICSSTSQHGLLFPLPCGGNHSPHYRVSYTRRQLFAFPPLRKYKLLCLHIPFLLY